jgi:23S rRNA pseudouridine1911/1915/1917 synthase
MEIIYWVTSADHGLRAVDVLTSRTGMSRLQTKKIRLYGQLLKNGQPWRMIDPVYSGDQLIARTAEAAFDRPPLRRPAEIDFIYEDDWLAILNKPAGIVVHPTYRYEKGTITDLLADHPLHPVSRLDRDTSGLVMIAKNGHAHYVVTQHPMQKIYLAVVHGRMEENEGLIEAPIARASDSIIARIVSPDGAPAATRYNLVRYWPILDVSVVRFELLTGRTHQIRVHSQFLGHPLVGDTLYRHAAGTENAVDRLIGRQALHAISLQFTHPVSLETIRVSAPLPADFRRLLKALS